ncbi:hypothetical protein ACKLKD_01880 [Klebsiella sp. 10982]|uniref:hypothetical protein n=1 Tax=Klebsiella TaxID=570 RepID=UPI000472E8AE|nr:MULTISPECIES: hypothetical protein [Klebsiella]MCS5989544.1 hypothetical protein [Klebsiella variicola subsp. variicola]QBL49184.1 hypothetical protein BMD99_011920 [Klebsiella sp. PO552]MBK2371243.1 hypothetical protein [Klebsiella quasivariicola]MBS5208073.1 hypothetical protein [Klebsiella sp.]MDF2004810.1 hypothetical protein [Klebsiella quasivariicola]
MKIFNDREKFEIKESIFTFESLIADAPPEISSMLKGKNVIILPSHGYEDVYYTGTLDTLDYLNENNISAEVYATDDEYKELGLHAADIWLGTFIIKNFVIPIFCSVVSAYIYDKIKAKKNDKISLTFIVEKKDGKTVSIEYNGKIENLNEVLNAVKGFSNEY